MKYESYYFFYLALNYKKGKKEVEI